MHVADLINGSFEFLGSIAAWINVAAIYKDKKFSGCRIAPIVLFTSWGYWNIYYYPSLHQFASFAGGLSLVVANTAYVLLMLKYK